MYICICYRLCFCCYCYSRCATSTLSSCWPKYDVMTLCSQFYHFSISFLLSSALLLILLYNNILATFVLRNSFRFRLSWVIKCLRVMCKGTVDRRLVQRTSPAGCHHRHFWQAHIKMLWATHCWWRRKLYVWPPALLCVCVYKSI